MMNRTHPAKKVQSGAAGVFVSIALVVVLGLISLQNITATSSELYLSNTRQSIEEARQLAFAGLRHYTHNFGSDEAIAAMIDRYKDNSKVVGECSYTVPLPETLTPSVILATPATPDDPRQSILIRGIVVPYNCSRSLSDDNYRATFEIVASVNCVSNVDAEAGCVKRSFVFNRQDDDDGKLAYLPLKPPPKPPSDDRDDDDHKDDDRDNDKNDDKDDNNEDKPEPPKSRGRQEVGF